MSPPPRSAIAHLLEQPHRFGFIQAVRLIERWQRRPGLPPPQDAFGRGLRFRNSLSLAFPASEIAEFRVVATGGPREAAAGRWPDAGPEASTVARIEITPAFMGLLGAGGTLPRFYTELFARREWLHKDGSSRRFLDIFVHRAVVLFYQAWRKHRLPLRFETDRHQEFLPCVLALAGLGQTALRNRLRAREGGVADDALALYAGLLQQRPVSAAVIGQLLSHYLGVGVRLDQFVGRWFALPPDQQTTLGRDHATLGAQAVVGERIWQRDLRLRLTLGPLGRAQFTRFLPGPPAGPGLVALRELLTLLTGVVFEYEVRLCLRAADVQPARLHAADAPRLGWTGFLTTRPAAQDRSDAGYDLHALA